jgi:hypothetical protein
LGQLIMYQDSSTRYIHWYPLHSLVSQAIWWYYCSKITIVCMGLKNLQKMEEGTEPILHVQYSSYVND